ncbi:MAG: GNAT family N-acetyltransferase [Planctomycetota bacterium]
MQIEYLADHLPLLPIVAKWHHEEWDRSRPDATVEERIARLQQWCGRRCIGTTFIALVGDAPVGCASLVAHDMRTQMELTPWLGGVYVAPDHRRQGIGSALVTRAVDEARKLSVERLYLYTADQERFYARLGWSVVEQCQYRGQGVVVMTLQLAA